jgi:hypothetical protein
MKIIYHDNGNNPGWKSLPFPIKEEDLHAIHLHATCLIIIPKDYLSNPLLSLLESASAHPLFQRGQL